MVKNYFPKKVELSVSNLNTNSEKLGSFFIIYAKITNLSTTKLILIMFAFDYQNNKLET